MDLKSASAQRTAKQRSGVDPNDFRSYLGSGWQPIPLRKASKAPLDSEWTKRKYDPRKVVDACILNGRNMGIRLRADQLVLDVDPRRGGRNGFRKLCNDLRLKPKDWPCVLTGGGGRHYYLTLPPGTRIVETHDEFEGIEFKSVGRQVVAAGSIHPDTGIRYHWSPDHPRLSFAPEAPAALIDLIRFIERSGHETVGGQCSPEQIAKMLDALDPIDFRDEAKWRRLMFAVHHASGGAACDVFIDWSTKDPMFSDHAEEIGNRWKSLQAGRNDGITYKSLNRFLAEVGRPELQIAPRADEVGADFPDAPEKEPDPLEGLLQRTAVDKSAPFAEGIPSALARLAPHEYEALRAKLESIGFKRLKALDDARRKSNPKEKVKRASVDVLAKLSEEADYFQESDGTTYARVVVNEKRVTLAVKSSQFKRWLTARFREETKRVPNDAALRDAIHAIDSTAADTPKQRIFLRVGSGSERIFVDLCDEQNRIVEIDRNGWRIIDSNALPEGVDFRRADGMLALPAPEKGGSLTQLRSFLNVAPEGDSPSVNDGQFVLFVMWIAHAFRSGVAYPVLAIDGEQGTGKSMTLENARSLIDPAMVALRPWPRDERDLYVSTRSNHVLAFDNVSTMPAALSDAFCRVATGGGFGTRKLYTDMEEVTFKATRPQAINGINNIVWRNDLVDRTIFLTLHPLDGARKSESDMRAEFRKLKPQIFGVLCSMIAHGLKNIPQMPRDEMPRMTEFDLFGRACETFAWKAGTFRNAYEENRRTFKDRVLAADPVARALLQFMPFDTWTGSATELYKNLQAVHYRDEDTSGDWPDTPNHLSRRLRVIAPDMRAVHQIDIRTDGRNGDKKAIFIRWQT